jgi:hypothetical protein
MSAADYSLRYRADNSHDKRRVASEPLNTGEELVITKNCGEASEKSIRKIIRYKIILSYYNVFTESVTIFTIQYMYGTQYIRIPLKRHTLT